MKKTIITTLIAISIFLSGALIENIFLSRSFSAFQNNLKILYDKTELKSATLNDAYSTQEFWHKQKEYLHTVIPHTEIKEIDLWISEAVRLIAQKNFSEAQQKIEVLLELSNQIPSSFKIKLRNVFWLLEFYLYYCTN